MSLIKIAYCLGKDELENNTITIVYTKSYKTNYLRMLCTSKSPILELEKLPFGQYWSLTSRTNCRKYCLCSSCAKVMQNTILVFIFQLFHIAFSIFNTRSWSATLTWSYNDNWYKHICADKHIVYTRIAKFYGVSIEFLAQKIICFEYLFDYVDVFSSYARCYSFNVGKNIPY